MKRLIKNDDIILDGTAPRYQKEKEAFHLLSLFEDLLERHELKSIDELEEVLNSYDENLIYMVQIGGKNS